MVFLLDMCVCACTRMCVRTYLQIMGLRFLWGKHRAFLVTLADTSAYVPLGQRPQGTYIECDVSLGLASIIGI